MKFLLAVMHGLPRRHSNSSITFEKKRKKCKHIFMTILGPAESFKPVVLNLFLTVDRSTLENFTADHPGSVKFVNRGVGGGGRGKVSESLI